MKAYPNGAVHAALPLWLRVAVVACVAAVGVLLAVASPAHAVCYSSSPSSATDFDSWSDGEGGLAPEITSLDASVNASCGLTANPVISGGWPAGSLVPGDSVALFVNTDGNPSTGDVDFAGADRMVLTLGQYGTDNGPWITGWNGAYFDFSIASLLQKVGAGGFAASLDQLGVAAPTTVTMVGSSLYEGTYADYYDFAPEYYEGALPLTAAFSTVPPPPPPAPAPQAPVTQPAPAKKGCVVPRVRGLTVSRAKKKLRQAGCRFTVKGRGKVTSSSPRSGTRTTARVVVRTKRGGRFSSAAAVRTPESVQALKSAERAIRAAHRRASR